MAVMLWLVTLSLSAQPSTPPTFKSATNLVEATAVVRDQQGRTIGNLTADDFELFDNGKRETISHFTVEKQDRPEAVAMPGGNSGTTVRAAAALPNHFTAFVVDDQNLVPEHYGAAPVAAIRYLSEMRPRDRAAVTSASGRMVLEFTGDRDKLRKALSNIAPLDRRETYDVSRLNGAITCKITYLKADWILRGDAMSLRNCVPIPGLTPPVPELGRPLGRPPASIMPTPAGEERQIFLENQVRAFAESIVQAGDRDVHNYLLSLARLIDTMSRLPGERSIILLSPGMYLPARFRKLQDEIIAEAVRAHVVIGGVDPRGVYLRDDPADPSTLSDTWGLAETNARNGFMDDVASGTGGTFIRGDNDIEGAIQRLVAVPEYIYVLGFSPSPSRLDDKYHALRIALRRVRGLTVNARRGYYAATADTDQAASAERQIRDAFFSSREWRDLPVNLQIRSSHKADLPIVLTAIARIDLNKVPFRKQDGVNRSDLTMVVGLFDQNGNPVSNFWKDIDLHPADDALAVLRSAGIEVSTDFTVEPGRYVVRLLVRVSEGRAMGSHSTGVEIRP